MKKVIVLFLPFLFASSLASAEEIAIKTKDGDLVHWKDYWQDKDTGNYCTNIQCGEFCLDKNDIVQIYKGKDASRLDKKTRQWTNTASGRSLDIIARQPQTAASAPTRARAQARPRLAANTYRSSNHRTANNATHSSNNQGSTGVRRGST